MSYGLDDYGLGGLFGGLGLGDCGLDFLFPLLFLTGLGGGCGDDIGCGGYDRCRPRRRCCCRRRRF